MKKHLSVLSLLSVVVFFIACNKELSFENGGTPSLGALQSDLTDDCLPKTVAGVYEASKALDATNYIDVTVDVVQAGSYLIYTDTTNGIYFRATGLFTTAGANTVRLKAFGTPVTDGISNFVVTYGLSQCMVAVTILPAGGSTPAEFTLSAGTGGDCMGANVQGTYTQGVALTSANTVTINVNVTKIGTYSVSTTATNGMTFSASDVFASTGAHTITLVGSGTPTTASATTIPVTVGTSSCSFPVTVIGPATYTINCGSAVVNGTYAQGVALTASNTVNIQVSVAATGGYSITGTVSGMTFAKSGNFAITGNQTITLDGSGIPTASGPINVPLTGGTAGCSFPVTVTGPAQFTVNCGSAVVNGDYEEGIALDASNTVNIQVNVISAGPYTITGTGNGMTFTKSGSFAAPGNQTITLIGSGTPAADGVFNIQVNSGSTACTFPVTVDPGVAPPTIDWKFTEGATTYQGAATDVTLQVVNLPPITSFGMLFYDGESPAGDFIMISLTDVSGSPQVNETYTTTATSSNSATFNFTTASGTEYSANSSVAGTAVTFKITAHNTTTKTIEGTFSGTVKDDTGATKTISNGTFKGTYP